MRQVRARQLRAEFAVAARYLRSARDDALIHQLSRITVGGLALGVAALILAFITLQRRGYAYETYQAIWGPDPRHPGNQKLPTGWAVKRPSEIFHPNAGE